MFPKSFGLTSGIHLVESPEKPFCKRGEENLQGDGRTFCFHASTSPQVGSFVPWHEGRCVRRTTKPSGKALIGCSVCSSFNVESTTQNCRYHTQSSESFSEDGADRRLCSLHSNSFEFSSRICQEFKHLIPAKTTFADFQRWRKQSENAGCQPTRSIAGPLTAVPAFTFFFRPFPASPPLFHPVTWS